MLHLTMWVRKLRPPSICLTTLRFVSGSTRNPRNAYQRSTSQRRRLIRGERNEPTPPLIAESSKAGAISEALHNARPEDNDLLSPVHIPEDPNGILNERHPAFPLLANSAVVVTRQLELMNVLLGFEQANRYVIMDPQGNHIGFMAEPLGNLGTHLGRQFFTTHRSFTVHIFDKHEREVLRIQRPFSWINSRIRVHDPLVAASSSNNSRSYQDVVEDGRAGQISTLPFWDMRVIGEAQQQWAPLRRKYNLFLYHDSPNMATDTKGIFGGEGLSESQQLQVAEGGRGPGEFSQFAYVDEPFLSWDFSLMTADSNLLGSVNRNFQGFGREILTDTGVYALRMDAAGLADEPTHLISQTGRSAQSAYGSKTMGMTLDQRAVMLATAVSIDFDYFSRKSGGGGFGFMPWLWFPEATARGSTVGAAGEADVTTGAAEEAGASAATTAAKTAASGVARGAGGIGEGAAVGAGSIAGNEAMQRGLYGESAQQPPPNEQAPPPSQEQAGEEDIWDTGSKDPWSSGGDGESTGGDLGGGGSDWF